MSSIILSVIFLVFLSSLSWLVGRRVTRLLPSGITGPRTFLALPLGLTTFLVSFSIIAHIVPSYYCSLPLSFLFPFLLTKVFTTRNPSENDSRSQNSICFLIFFTVLCITLYLHSLWPALHWDNSGDRAGVEKLFNLSIQQSFLYGHTFPPEWIWLSGETSHYYLLPKVLPGMASWLARVVANDPDAGPITYILSEGIFLGLISGSMTAWIMLLLNTVAPGASSFLKSGLSALLGILVFLDCHLSALYKGLGHLISQTPLNWWSLQEQVVQYTQNQYPLWLVMLGDNHAYLQIVPFQLSLWALTLLLLLETRVRVGLAILVGITGAAVFLSHAPSILLNSVTLAPALVSILLWERAQRNFSRVSVLLKNFMLAWAILIAAVVPNLTVTGDTKKVFPDSSVVSPFFQFLSVQFWPLLWIALVTVSILSAKKLTSIAFRKTLQDEDGVTSRSLLEWISILSVLAIAYSLYFERPAIGVALLLGLAAFTFVTASTSALTPERQRALAFWTAWTFGIWILPELLAIDNRADNRTLWIRFNIVLRFWPEGYYLIPLAVTVGLGSPLLSALEHKRTKRYFFSAGIFLCILFALSHIPGIQNRSVRAPEEPSLNGSQFIHSEAPHDAQIIHFLSHLPAFPKVVLAESCGTNLYPGVPVNYSWPGRISAFSGRLAVCGWARHAFLHQPVLLNDRNGVSETWGRLEFFEEAWLTILKESGVPLSKWNALDRENFFADRPHVQNALEFFRQHGVTHIVYGDFETRAYGPVVLEKLAETVKGKIVFRASGAEMGVIEIQGVGN